MTTTVKKSTDLVKGKNYLLRELPDSVNFSIRTRIYKTLTHPPYNTMNPAHMKRPCLNLRTMETEELSYQTVVKII